MKQIKLTITAKSPLSISRKKIGSISEATDFIPGSVIRGAIAGMMLRSADSEPEAGDDFSKLFVEEDAAIFSNAYPTQAESEVDLLPSTAVSSKTQPGFKGKGKGKGVFDTLINRFCTEQWGQIYNPNFSDNDGDRIEPFLGFYTKNDKKYESQSVTKRLLTRVGINRRRATSEEEILYSLEVINESKKVKDEAKITKVAQVYQSNIKVFDDQIAKALTKFIDDNSQKIRLGGSKSRGLGKVEILSKLVDITPSPKQRITDFNQKLNNNWQSLKDLYSDFYTPEDSVNKRVYFTVNLQSDGIFSNNWQKTTVLSSQMLSEFAGVTDESLKLHSAYSSYDYISGWNAAWGLMKDIELITTRGSVFLFSTQNIDSWYSALEQLENRGIGERTTEGFGSIQVCNPFHLISQENLV